MKPYKALVTVTQEFDSRDDAEAFVEKVLESTKGADFEKNIRYLKPRANTMSGGGPYAFNHIVNNPPLTDTATSVQQRVTKAAQLGLLRDGE